MRLRALAFNIVTVFNSSITTPKLICSANPTNGVFKYFRPLSFSHILITHLSIMDFTQKQYTSLLTSIKKADFSFQTFEGFLQNPLEKVVILRHDVDRLPFNSLATAEIESELGIKGSYYFRIVNESNNVAVINQIAELGHEIGYHYETMDSVRQKTKGKRQKATEFASSPKANENPSEKLMDEAYEEFCKNLVYFRTLYPVKTICMHGSPLSKYDNRDIWEKYDYRKLGIIGEPYFDIDFSKVLYLTDTGRRWDGERVSVRDKVKRSVENGRTGEWERERKGEEEFIEGKSGIGIELASSVKPNQELEPKRSGVRRRQIRNQNFKHTQDIIKAMEAGHFPNQAMITIHPQRWNDALIPWTKELVMQNIKNVVKWGLIKIR